MDIRITALACAALAAPAMSAHAHASLEQKKAVTNSYHKAVLQVGHGCKGSPTVSVQVRIPEGVTSAKPQAKPGWTLTIKRTKLPKPIDAGHGRTIDEVVSEVVWAGGNLPDAEFDEFKLMMKLPDRPGTTLYIPVVQHCKEGVHRWIEVPTAGKTGPLAEPAPALELMPKP